MAGTYNADTMSNGAVTQLEKGENCFFANWGISESLSGATLVNLALMPAGSRIVGVTYFSKYGLGGTGGEQIHIAVQGKAIIKSATEATVVRETSWEGIGYRITSDATMTLQFCNVVGTGTGSNVIRVAVRYMTDQDGD